ncbi:MAG: DUF5666 domain-containing protein [Dehalococcoidia bacterium]
MTTRRFEELLDECLDVLRAGAGIDDCVAPYPEHAAELREQLAFAQTLLAAGPALLPRPGAQLQGRAVLLSAVAEQASAPETRPSALQALAIGIRRFAMLPQAIPALLILLVLGGTAVGVSAATGSPSRPFTRLLGSSSSEHRIDLRGTVESVDAAALTITTETGPQTVVITPDTEFKGIAALADLGPGDTVKVRASRETDGTLVAREIEREHVADSQGPAPANDGQNDDPSGPGSGDDNDAGDDHSGPGNGEDDDSSGPGNDSGQDDDDDDGGQGSNGGQDEDEGDDDQGPPDNHGGGNGGADDGSPPGSDDEPDDNGDDDDNSGPGGGNGNRGEDSQDEPEDDD